jgi:PKHD-type hydroxylase
MTGSEHTTVPRGKGPVVIFPSFLLHRVVPLTSGNRKSLVLWVGGGQYK